MPMRTRPEASERRREGKSRDLSRLSANQRSMLPADIALLAVQWEGRVAR